MLWDRIRDEFNMGQWLKGRLYERQCDLSPDGKYLLYFARKAGNAWSAISLAPYLKAIANHPIGGELWNGGGLWTGESTYRLTGGLSHSLPLNCEAVASDESNPPVGMNCTGDSSVYSPRLTRDGWNLTRVVRLTNWHAEQTFEKSISPVWTLRKIAHPEIGAPVGKGCYWEEHQLVHQLSGATLDCPQWEWADLDGTRLVWATGGKLFSGSVLAEGLVNETQLFDFNEMMFSPIEAPY